MVARPSVKVRVMSRHRGCRVGNVALALALALLAGAPVMAQTGCRTGNIVLGTFFEGGDGNGALVIDRGPGQGLAGAIPVRVPIDCPAGPYRLRLVGSGNQGSLRLSQAGFSAELIPYAVAVNGQPIMPAVDLVRDGIVLSGASDIDIVFAASVQASDFPAGTYLDNVLALFEFP